MPSYGWLGYFAGPKEIIAQQFIIYSHDKGAPLLFKITAQFVTIIEYP